MPGGARFGRAEGLPSCLEVPEAITQDKTIEEARENLKDAIHSFWK